MTPTSATNSIEVLLARVESATGPDRELDVELCLAFSYIGCVDAPINLRRTDEAVWLDYEVEEDGQLVDCTDTAPELTASIDQALGLVSRVLPGWFGSLDWAPPKPTAYLNPPNSTPANWSGTIEADGATLPLAILAALLKALIAQGQKP